MPQDEDKTLFHSSILSVILHAGVIVALVTAGAAELVSPVSEMFVVLSEYDPLGGDLGEGLRVASPPHPIPYEPEFYPPEPEDFEEEYEEEPPDLVELIQSTTGEEMPQVFEEPQEEPPPKKEAKPKPKPKPRPAPQAPPQEVPAVTAAGEGNLAPSAGQSVGTLGPGGQGGGTGKGTARILDSYISKVRNKMDRNKKYPTRTNATSGVVEINFTILSSGQVVGAKIVASSGNDAFDDEVMALLRRVSPFAPIPAELGRDSLNLTVPVVFSRR
ncbi:MAG: energy transducer TonB [Deltaproteobacteria bacterium]|jgi:protein TonB|nr:energy transducer TonB [Deltaproteobacteria bacterium]